jgi:DNA-binding PadR family transcriptional regulator
MLAIWKLKNNAFGISIRNNVMEITKSTLHFGSMYNTLELLEKKGFVKTSETEPQAKRGGRRRKLYSLTSVGIKVLKYVREIQNFAWAGISEGVLESE